MPSALAPLSSRVFRTLWIANTASNIGTWMQDVGAAWFMTTLTASPVYIALMQAATSFPLFLLALPSGVAADLVDRKKLLIATTAWIAVFAALLGIAVLSGLRSPGVLLGVTFVMNLGAALFIPAWQASVPEMVPKEQLAGALALNSASLNVARAIGPAIGGALLVSLGPWACFFLNALTCLALVMLLRGWKRPAAGNELPPEQFIAAMRIGLRYVRHSEGVKATLVRTGLFIVPAAALFALLPVLVKRELQLGASAYGTLLGCVGIGALAGVYCLAQLRARFSSDQLVNASSIALAAVFFGLRANTMLALAPLMLIGGFAWLLGLSSFHVSVMGAVPSWVRGRAGAVYLFVFYGGMSAGAAAWGLLASRLGTLAALVVAGGFLAAGALLGLRFRLPRVGELDLAPSGRWAEPAAVRAIEPHGQAVMVMVEYRVDPARHSDFKQAMAALRTIRHRDGAFSWQLGEETSDPELFLEIFFVESWTEHLHQHQRPTVSDRVIEDRAKAFHKGPGNPRVAHFMVSRLK
ncbi:MAG: MFS transporter [Oligoflexia bacterium]|nr:MFS transporter [Oligoflexia bacterium]